VDQDFDVSPGSEAVAFCFEAFSQFEVIKDLAITAQDERPVLVEQRLITRFEIDDAEPARANRDVRIDEIPARIRPAMNQRISHPLKNLFFNTSGVKQINVTNYAAHFDLVCTKSFLINRSGFAA